MIESLPFIATVNVTKNYPRDVVSIVKERHANDASGIIGQSGYVMPVQSLAVYEITGQFTSLVLKEFNSYIFDPELIKNSVKFAEQEEGS